MATAPTPEPEPLSPPGDDAGGPGSDGGSSEGSDFGLDCFFTSTECGALTFYHDSLPWHNNGTRTTAIAIAIVARPAHAATSKCPSRGAQAALCASGT